MIKSKTTLLCMLFIGISNLIPVNAIQNPYLVCDSKKLKVYIDRDLKFDKQVTAKTKSLGSAVHETTLTMQGKQLVARFDCRSEQSNISLDTKSYILVEQNSCAGAVYKTVCGF